MEARVRMRGPRPDLTENRIEIRRKSHVRKMIVIPLPEATEKLDEALAKVVECQIAITIDVRKKIDILHQDQVDGHIEFEIPKPRPDP